MQVVFSSPSRNREGNEKKWADPAFQAPRLVPPTEFGVLHPWDDLCDTPGSLGRAGIHPSQRGRRIFSHELAGLIERVSKELRRGKEIKVGLFEISHGWQDNI